MRTTFANAVSACSELLMGDRALPWATTPTWFRDWEHQLEPEVGTSRGPGCQGLSPASRLPLRWAGLDLNQRLTDYESRQRVSGRFGPVG